MQTTSQSISTVTFSKLRSGDWRVRVVGPAPRKGQALVATRKDGSRDTVTVATVVWTGRDDVGRTLSLCAIERRPSFIRMMTGWPQLHPLA